MVAHIIGKDITGVDGSLGICNPGLRDVGVVDYGIAHGAQAARLTRAGFDQVDKGRIGLQACMHFAAREMQMFGEQVVLEIADGTSAWPVACFYCQIAFGIESHRAIVGVGRANGQKPVVYDQHLAVYTDVVIPEIIGMRIADAQPVMTVGRPQQAHEAATQQAHGVFLQPAARALWQHDDDLRRILAGENGAQRITEEGGREILVFDVDVAPGCGQCVDVELADFGDGGLSVVGRLGPADGDRHGVCGLCKPPGPVVTGDSRRVDGLTRGPQPALPGERPECCGDFAAHRHLYVVKGPVGLARRISAARVMAAVLAGVEAAYGQVESADERQRIIDDDDLLVMRGRHRMIAVEGEAQAFVRVPALPGGRQQGFALKREDEREIPAQQVDAQVRLALESGLEKRREPLFVITPVASAKSHAAVYVPAERDHAVFGGGDRFSHGAEIVDGVDGKAHRFGGCDLPAVSAGL